VIAALAMLAALAAQEPVQTGLDVLVEERFASLRGQRLGVIANHTALARDGRHLVDLLLAAEGVTVRALFAPEHGFAGVLDRAVADARHASGLRIHSLYGEHREPTPESLAGLDALVFDIQDVGCRFYTYISTMGLAMEAAAQAGVRFVVLDRPNPIGGIAVAGPVLGAGLESFTGHHRLPVRHGMTVGELARLFAAERGLELGLRVVAMRGWQRAQLFADTGLRWIDPSPNMRSLRQALLYPGIGLLEFTNLSVGRGTDTPFELLGAPWLDALGLAAALRAQGLPGVVFVPRRFTPEASRFANQECHGLEILVTDWRSFEPLRTGLAIACALRDRHPRDWERAPYAKLLANDAVFAAFAAGASAAELEAAWQSELADFRRRRAPFLLY
jgi:uncharacterized protein YbbC (DUF1343 family)